ncbi:MAG: DUF4411 domain-containing protein [Candidatus Altiarchaeales archaeon HGW-Altiarchaeales-1]|nr:MAG: DUF4411 domain-containing protein [Candidatus Altiarchaeales archaeon HGW-Altiarchaeales-2]PKP59732.1 MAG: DUF4411 domain-containing protein [Candidatus Altiarchaeales archaeon HGW-Altiarchaeales-1]
MEKHLKLSENLIYCIDADALINIKKHYPKDIDLFSPIWNKLEDMVKNDTLISSIEVFEEINDATDKNDFLLQWSTKNKNMFRGIDDNCQKEEFENVKSKYDKDYWDKESAKGPWADPWLIALSICKKATLVTSEKNAQNHIPYIADCFKIHSMNLLDFFRKIKIK